MKEACGGKGGGFFPSLFEYLTFPFSETSCVQPREHSIYRVQKKQVRFKINLESRWEWSGQNVGGIPSPPPFAPPSDISV